MEKSSTAMCGHAEKKERNTMLEQSQRNIEEQLSAVTSQLSAIVDQLERQADSTFSGQSWAAFSEPGFDDKLMVHGKALIELGERLKSGKLPAWKLYQDEAYRKSAIGLLKQSSTSQLQDDHNQSKD
jgi:hypothetical protein